MKNFPAPRNEPVRSYAPGTAERESLKRALASISGSSFDVPLRIAVGQQPLNVRGCNDCASERSEAGGADTVKSKELRGRLASGADGC